MPYKATVAVGKSNIIVGGRGPFKAGDVVMLTDAEFVQMDPAAFALIFTGAPAALNTSTASPYP